MVFPGEGFEVAHRLVVALESLGGDPLLPHLLGSRNLEQMWQEWTATSGDPARRLPGSPAPDRIIAYHNVIARPH